MSSARGEPALPEDGAGDSAREAFVGHGLLLGKHSDHQRLQRRKVHLLLGLDQVS